MLLRDDDTVLWLRDRSELQAGAAPTHAILWPAFEYTALVSADAPDPSRLQLDPFQRAVLGLARNGVIEVERQAEWLDLHPDFVAHLQDCLRSQHLIDRAGRPGGDVSDSPRTIAAAVRIYQDPFTGALWSGYATNSQRRSLPIDASEQPAVDAGTTGEPLLIRTFVVRPPKEQPATPTADDARNAVRDWSRTLRQQRSRKEIVQDGPVQLIPDSRQRVYLVCPNGRTGSREPDVADPFGGPSNRGFRRTVASLASTLEPLGRWVYGEAATTLAPPKGREDPSLTGRLGIVTAERQTELARIGARRQVRQDIDAIGHQALDLIWSAGTDRVEDVAADLIADRTLLDHFARTYGFVPGTVPAIADLRSICSGDSAPLVERSAAALMRYRPDIAGPIHRVARRCPDLFQLLGESVVGDSTRGLEQLSTAAFALAEEADRLMTRPRTTTGADADGQS